MLYKSPPKADASIVCLSPGWTGSSGSCPETAGTLVPPKQKESRNLKGAQPPGGQPTEGRPEKPHSTPTPPCPTAGERLAGEAGQLQGGILWGGDWGLEPQGAPEDPTGLPTEPSSWSPNWSQPRNSPCFLVLALLS